MDTPQLLTTLLFLAGVVNRIVELLKPTIEALPVDDAWRAAITRALAIALGIVAVVGGGTELNLFSLSEVYGQINPIVGLFFTGVVVGGFSNLLYALAELLTRKPIARE